MRTTRRTFLQAGAGLATSMTMAGQNSSFVSKRPAASKRRFTSPAVEDAIRLIKPQIADPELGWMFENCFPNTLDTTVFAGQQNGKPDTFLITGDIDAMWLRDSSAQVVPYLKLAKDDAALRRMLTGLIHRQSSCILLDSYANAFTRDARAKPLPWAVKDKTAMHAGVGERKWEIDSLCYPIRLAHGYWKSTGDLAPFDAQWQQAAARTVATFREQQRKSGPGPYRFQRTSETPTETQFLGGLGNPTRPNGMIHSMFRPSDDACLYPLFVPANLFAATSLRQLAELVDAVSKGQALAQQANELAAEVLAATEKFGVLHKSDGDVWAYEVDGFGNQLFMDDANAPSLLSLPYLGCCEASDARYQRTRKLVWSRENPYYFAGTAGRGIGGPHEGLRMIWPMSILLLALTSEDESEIRDCLRLLKTTHAGTGFMHESFDQDDATHFTRPWFAWANTLFGELIVRLHEERPHLLNAG